MSVSFDLAILHADMFPHLVFSQTQFDQSVVDWCKKSLGGGVQFFNLTLSPRPAPGLRQKKPMRSNSWGIIIAFERQDDLLWFKMRWAQA